MATRQDGPSNADAELIEVIRTTLKRTGDGQETAVHTHEQFWTKDGELLAENCCGDYCDG